MQIQYNCGAISKESIIRNSPYTVDVSKELERINKDNKNDTSVIKAKSDKELTNTVNNE